MIQFFEKNQVYVVENEYGKWCLKVTQSGRSQTGRREYFVVFEDITTGEEYMCERESGEMSVILGMDVTNHDNYISFGMGSKVFP